MHTHTLLACNEKALTLVNNCSAKAVRSVFYHWFSHKFNTQQHKYCYKEKLCAHQKQYREQETILGTAMFPVRLQTYAHYLIQKEEFQW